ncbi:MAG: phosphoribosyltransferase [Cyclobacteriaceae bacterium]|jgi:predicted phosphoribosyltransferase|nr:phosphoribosyltransferase [Cyclobacteriaceae bacterium]
MFKDRKEGGQQLARVLRAYRDQQVLVLGIPRGGVETAYYVATELHAELSLVVCRKLGYPFNPEAAFGAMAEDGSLFIFEEARGQLPPEIIQSIVSRERREIARRIHKLRHDKPLPPIKGRTVILVDDGIATGATLFAAIELCRRQQAGKIIVAAPVSGHHVVHELKERCDEVVILTFPKNFFAVSQGYERFHDVDDETVIHLLDLWEDEHLVPVIEKR